MALRLSDDHVEFLESGVSTMVATRDGRLRPEVLRAYGTLVAADRASLVVLFPEALAQRSLANLADNGAISITFSRVVDHRSLQVKGKAIGTRAASADECALQERYLASFVEQLYWVGLPRTITRRMHHAPAVAVTVALDELFTQTPGPGAGRKIESP